MKIPITIYESIEDIFIKLQSTDQVFWSASHIRHRIKQDSNIHIEWIDEDGINKPYLVTRINDA